MNAAARGHLAMLCFSGLIAGSFALGSLASPYIGSTAMNAVRFALAAVLLGIVAQARVGLTGAQFRAPWRFVILGGLMGFYFVTMFEGLKTAPPVSLSAVFTLMPVVAGGFGYILMRQVMTRRMALALSFGGLGALWVIFRADLNALVAFEVGRGVAIYFMGCVAHALYAPLVPRLNRGESPIAFSFGALVAATGMILVAGWGEIRATDWAALPPIVWITVVYTAAMATALTFVLLQYATLRLPSAKVMAYTYLTPVWVICWLVALGEGLPPLKLLPGVALILVALALLLKDEHGSKEA
ncbi:DMT family transporter [Roseovarius sp. A21]|uniref:DMT family transporter n=1 Tax=Roseovarius bejariae TaxID=2576383 RepID=A0A844CJW5_9RHOB|nr:DMT family transporter [Roseovarius bejariae]MRU15007.1 DMT family transporter [Roseovarius bejariae]